MKRHIVLNIYSLELMIKKGFLLNPWLWLEIAINCLKYNASQGCQKSLKIMVKSITGFWSVGSYTLQIYKHKYTIRMCSV